jgi:adenylosuccinate lyase
LQVARENISVGKISGAVGTYANIDPRVEAKTLKILDLRVAPVSTQILQRDRHAEVMAALAVLGGSLEKLATEIRHLQKTETLELEEPFSEGQTGSSAMPHKRNPVNCERIAGLARILRGNALAALENIALWHERDISHSSVERVILPDTTILVDYALTRLTNILQNLQVYPQNMKRNLAKTESFLASEKIMLALVDKGLDRQKGYEMVQKNALEAWTQGKDFRALIEADTTIGQYLNKKRLAQCFDTSTHFRHVDTLFKRVGV